MIKLNELSPVGTFGKTHGVKGDINITLSDDFDFDPCDYVVVDIDGIFVPFFITEYRYKSNTTLLIHFEDIDDEPSIRSFFGKTVYVKKELIEVADEDETRANYYVGFIIKTEDGKEIGEIIEVNDTTENVLFVVGELLIPVAAIEIIDLDKEARTMTVDLPEGLLEI
ncbi:MAG: ribosome maturation factor RimM [bacterium]